MVDKPQSLLNFLESPFIVYLYLLGNPLIFYWEFENRLNKGNYKNKLIGHGQFFGRVFSLKSMSYALWEVKSGAKVGTNKLLIQPFLINSYTYIVYFLFFIYFESNKYSIIYNNI